MERPLSSSTAHATCQKPHPWWWTIANITKAQVREVHQPTIQPWHPPQITMNIGAYDSHDRTINRHVRNWVTLHATSSSNKCISTWWSFRRENCSTLVAEALIAVKSTPSCFSKWNRGPKFNCGTIRTRIIQEAEAQTYIVQGTLVPVTVMKLHPCRKRPVL